MSKYYKAEDVIKKLAEEYASTSKWSYGNDDTWEDWVDTASDILCDLPTIEVSDKADRPQGEWIKQGISPYEGIQRCSLCDEIYNITEEFNYCPNCGAKMKG